MASIAKREKSKYWTACFTSRDGRQLKRSTKTTDKSQAMEIALELERVERLAGAGEATTAQLRKVLNDVSEKVNGDSLHIPTTEDYIADWLKAVEARNTAGTTERYRCIGRMFLKSLNGKAKRPVSSVTPKDIEEFHIARLNSGLAPATAIGDLKILNNAFRRAENYNIILKNPVSAVRPPKGESSEREVFTAEEVQKLIKAAPSVEWQTLILLGYFLGARLRDCARLRWENVKPEHGVIVFNQKKNRKPVVIPMHFHIIEHLKYLSQFGTTGFLCPNLAEKTPGGHLGLSEGFMKILKRAGVDPMTVQGKGKRKFSKRTFHSLRHSFNSVLANAGVAEETRMKLTGHSSKAMNDRYTHLQVATLKSAVNTLPLFEAGVAAPAAAENTKS